MKKLICLSITALAFIGCAKGTNLDPVATAKDINAEPNLQGKNFVSKTCQTPSPTMETLRVAAASLKNGVPLHSSQQEVYNLTGGTVNHSYRYYFTSDCSGDAAFITSETGSFTIDKSSGNDNVGYHIDMDYKDLNVTVSTADGVNLANGGGLCGITNYTQGKEVTVPNTATGKANCYLATLPRSIANVYRLDGNNLYFGDIASTQNGTDNSNRPQSYDKNLPFVAQ